MRSPTTTSGPEEAIDQALDRVREALHGLRFGSIAVTVHEGRVVQIDVTEKKRLLPH